MVVTVASAIWMTRTTHTLRLRPPSDTASLFITGKRAKQPIKAASQTDRTVLVPHLLLSGTKKKIETTPLTTPNPARHIPTREGGIPRPPCEIGVLRNTGSRTKKAISI